LLPIFLVALSALALTFLTVANSAFARDGREGPSAGLVVSTEYLADQPVAPYPPTASPASSDGGARDVSGWWLLPLAAGLAAWGGLLVMLDWLHYFDDLD